MKAPHSKPRKVLSVGEVAARSGVAVSTIHFYERKGLIVGWRNNGNQRRYDREVLRRIAIIKVAQRIGIPLARIMTAIAALPGDRAVTLADWRKFSESWRTELDERITQLTRLRTKLDGCIGCGCLSMTECPLRNPEDIAFESGPGSRAFDLQ